MAICVPNPTETVSLVRAPSPRLGYIEGLRALAALWVMLSHMWISQFGLGTHSGTLGLASNWLLYSHLAVDVFIVLSGYCLYLPVQRDGGLLRAGPGGFLHRRARRILPPCYLALTLAVGITLLRERLDGVPLQIDVRALGVNLLLLQDLILRDNIFNGPLWSVAVEWRLSLVFPLLIWGLRRGGRPLTLLLAGAVGYGLTALLWVKAPSLLLSCPWYLLLFTMGLCAASFAPAAPRPAGAERWGGGRGWAVIGSAASVMALALLLRMFPVTAQGGSVFGRHMALIDAAAGLLAALALFGLRDAFDKPNAVIKVLSWPPLDLLGRFSYSLYLTHEPLLRLLLRLMKAWPVWDTAPIPLRFTILAGIGTPLLIGLAYLFFLCCERPFMTSRRTRVLAPSTREAAKNLTS